MSLTIQVFVALDEFYKNKGTPPYGDGTLSASMEDGDGAVVSGLTFTFTPESNPDFVGLAGYDLMIEGISDSPSFVPGKVLISSTDGSLAESAVVEQAELIILIDKAKDQALQSTVSPTDILTPEGGVVTFIQPDDDNDRPAVRLVLQRAVEVDDGSGGGIQTLSNLGGYYGTVRESVQRMREAQETGGKLYLSQKVVIILMPKVNAREGDQFVVVPDDATNVTTINPTWKRLRIVNVRHYEHTSQFDCEDRE